MPRNRKREIRKKGRREKKKKKKEGNMMTEGPRIY